MQRIHHKKGFASLIGMVIALCLIVYIAYVVLQKKPAQQAGDFIPQELESETALDTANYRTIVESSKAAVNTYNKDVRKRQKQYEEILN